VLCKQQSTATLDTLANVMLCHVAVVVASLLCCTVMSLLCCSVVALCRSVLSSVIAVLSLFFVVGGFWVVFFHIDILFFNNASVRPSNTTHAKQNNTTTT